MVLKCMLSTSNARPPTHAPCVQAQKYSVQKQLRRRFQRFLAAAGDYHHLLLTLLRGMARDAERTAALAAGGLRGAHLTSY